MKKTKKKRRSSSSPRPTYLYLRLQWLYLHSRRARFSFWYKVIFAKPIPKRKYITKKKRLVYDRFLAETAPKHRHLWAKAGATLVGLSIISIALQLAYPKDRTLPLSRLEVSGLVSFKSKAEIAQKLDSLDKQKVTISSEHNSIDTTLEAMGLEIDESATFAALSYQSPSERFIPFSILTSGVETQPIARRIDEQKLDQFVAQLIKTPSAPASTASIQLQGTKLIVKPAKNGFKYDIPDIKRRLSGLRFGGEAQFHIKPEPLLPKISTNLAKDEAQAIQRRIDQPLTIWAADQSMTITSATLASWMDIVVKPESQTIEMSFNKARVAASLQPLAASLETAARPGVSTVLNGSFAGTISGQSGQTIRFDELVQRVVDSTDWTVRYITAQVESILPQQMTEQRYSRDSQGIQTLLNQWAADHSGQYSVYMRTLNGNIEAAINPYQPLSSPVISRLYVAHLVYGQLAAKSLSLSSSTGAGMNVQSCLEQLLVRGHEGCFYALGNIVGWGSHNTMLAHQGFEDTSLVFGGGSTTARDTAEWFMRMHDSNIVRVSQTQSIIGLMSRHIYRSGIPAGSPKITVADIASNSTGSRQEAALVLHPKGAYVLVVFAATGGKANAVADLAAQINLTMNE